MIYGKYISIHIYTFKYVVKTKVMLFMLDSFYYLITLWAQGYDLPLIGRVSEPNSEKFRPNMYSLEHARFRRNFRESRGCC